MEHHGLRRYQGCVVTAPVHCRLEIRTRDVILPFGEQDRIERSFRLTLGKFEALLREVKVTLIADRGEHPCWLRCRIVARDRNNLVTRVEAEGREMSECVTRALSRAERMTRRRTSRARQRVTAGSRASF